MNIAFQVKKKISELRRDNFTDEIVTAKNHLQDFCKVLVRFFSDDRFFSVFYRKSWGISAFKISGND